MAHIYNFGLAGVSSGVQFGKGGTQILSNSGTFSATAADGSTLVRFQIADPQGNQDGVTLGTLKSTASTINANTATLTTEVRGVETGAGLASGSGNYTAPGSSNYLGSATSLFAADVALDGAIAGVQSELDAAEAAVGLSANGSFAGFTGTSFLNNATTVMDALTALDTAANTGVGAMTTEMTRAVAAKSTLNDNIASEVTRATTAEGNLTSALGAANTALSAAISQVQSNLDTDANSLWVSLTDTNANVAAEKVRAVQAENAISDALTSEISTARAHESTVQSNLDTEISRATNAEGLLSSNVASEVTRASAAEGVLTTNLSSEVTRATNAETTLNSNIASEVSRATNAESTLTTDLAAESAAARSAELVLTNAVTAIQSSYINKDGTVAFTGDQDMGGHKLTGLANPNVASDAVNLQTLNNAISGLGSAFAFVGTIGTAGADAGSAVSIADLTGPGGATLAAGDFYKVTAAGGGWLTDGTNPAFLVQFNDGIVYTGSGAGGGWEVVAHVDSQVFGDPGTITVTGSIDTGFTVSIDTMFQNSVSTLQGNVTQLANAIAAEALRADDAEVALTQALADEVSRANSAESTLTTNLSAEITRAEGAKSDLANSVAAEAARAGAVEHALSNTIAQNVMAAQAGNALVRANIALMDLSIGLSNVGAYVAPTGTTYLDTSSSVMGALGALDTALHNTSDNLATEVDRAEAAEALNANNLISNVSTLNTTINNLANTVAGNVANAVSGNQAMAAALASNVATLNTTINMVNSNVVANVATLTTSVNNIEAAVGLDASGNFVSFTGSNYMNAAATIAASLTALDTQLKATEDSLEDLTQYQIITASGKASVSVDDANGVVTALNVGGTATQVAAMIAGTSTNTSLTTDFTVANEITIAAGGPGDVDIHIEPAGSGQVFIGATGVAGVMQGEPGQQLTIAGGSTANLILGAGAGPSSFVQITDGAAKNVATFTGVSNATSFVSMLNGVGSATIAAAGSDSSVNLVLTAKGSGFISASNAKIVNVATGVSAADAANVGQMNTAISSAVTAAQTGALYAVSVAISETDGAVAIGAPVSGTIVRVRVMVGSAFNAASTISVATTNNGTDLMDPSMIDGSLSGQAFVTEAASAVTGTQLYAIVAASGSGGSATVLVEYLHA